MTATFLAATALSACTSSGDDAAPESVSVAATPTPAPTTCGTYTGTGCADPSRRVDLKTPTFSDPAAVHNPLWPIADLYSVLLLGHVDGLPFRTETTLLAGTETVDLYGNEVPVLVSQYVSYLDGRLAEVALDRYAQADDGSVWYLGEDVFDYSHGTVDLTEGTWLAGKEGPAAMIMPADPQLGQVYRTENIPGIVFEEVTIVATGKTVRGPLGPVDGAIVGRELHAEGDTEDKVFAPGYGEFRTSGGGELEALAMAVPTDAADGPMPAELHDLGVGTAGLLEAARMRDWEVADAIAATIRTDWAIARRGQPWMVVRRAARTVAALEHDVRRHKAAALEQDTIDMQQSVLDLQLRYRDQAEIDAERFQLWTQQLRVHADAGDLAGVEGDVATLEWVRDRFAPYLHDTAAAEIAHRLDALRGAADARNLAAAADHAARLGARIRHFEINVPSR